MKVASVVFTILIACSLHAQDTESKASKKVVRDALSATPTVRTTSGILRGVTEGNVCFNA